MIILHKENFFLFNILTEKEPECPFDKFTYLMFKPVFQLLEVIIPNHKLAKFIPFLPKKHFALSGILFIYETA